MDKCANCRKFGTKLFQKGDRCNSANCALTKRNYQPGSHGAKKTSNRKSEYGLQLLEKQKAKAEYGLREKQFANLFYDAAKSRTNTADEIFSRLESRLDNIVYRLGWAVSRAQARQLVTHKKMMVNDQKVNIPSINLRVGDKIKPIDASKIKPSKTTLPSWLKLDAKNFVGEVTRLPLRKDVETDIEEQLIIEFYSR